MTIDSLCVLVGGACAATECNAAQTASPATYDGLARQNVQIEPLGPQLWDVAVRYGSSDSGGNPTQAELVHQQPTAL